MRPPVSVLIAPGPVGVCRPLRGTDSLFEVHQPPLCPTCSNPLDAAAEGELSCSEGHEYTALGLALSSNIVALQAIWIAIRALEDDAGSLRYLASQLGSRGGMSAEERLAEADAAMEAAARLRLHAEHAQKRLDSLPSAPSSVVVGSGQDGTVQ